MDVAFTDGWFGNDAGTVDAATVTLHGRDGSQVNLEDDVYHYTNEVFTSLSRELSRLTLTDGAGTDWLKFAAMSGNLVVRLGEGQTSTGTSSAGVRNILTIAVGTSIENAVTGDGDDVITGNGLATRSTACAATTPSSVRGVPTRSQAAPATTP